MSNQNKPSKKINHNFDYYYQLSVSISIEGVLEIIYTFDKIKMILELL